MNQTQNNKTQINNQLPKKQQTINTQNNNKQKST